MKILFSFFVSVILMSHAFAADIKVDATGAIAGSQLTIQGAITTAASGDRIVIFSNNVNYYENLTIDKSLTLLCATQEEYFFLNGNITITPANGREITIIGMHQNGNITSASTNPVGARCIVNVVDCVVLGSVLFTHDGFDVNLLYNSIAQKAEFRHGKFIANKLGMTQSDQTSAGQLKISGEDVSYGVGDTVFIIANRVQRAEAVVTMLVEFNHPNARYFIANNSILNNGGSSGGLRTTVRITACLLTDSANVFINNYVVGYDGNSTCNAASTGAAAELKGARAENVVNNIFNNRYGGSYGCPLLGMRGDYNYFYKYDGLPLATGQFDNNISQRFDSPDITFDLETGKVTGGVDGIDKGKPGVTYMDIDLTRADLGTYGGPYTQENYWDTANPQGGRARVFMLDLPAKIYSLTSPLTIRANSTHTK